MYNNELDALNRVKRQGVRVKGKTITIGRDTVIGIKALGALDYLEKYHGYWTRREA
jgi:hypothetical protein